MASTKEKIGNFIAVAGVVNNLNADPGMIDRHEQVSQEKPPIEGPERPGERAGLNPNEQKKTVQEGPPKNPDPPGPTEVGPIQGSASFQQSELSAGGKPGPASESATYATNSSSGQAAPYSVNVSQEYGNQPQDKASAPSQTASYSAEANFGKSDFNASVPPPPPPPPQEEQEQTKTR